MRTLSKSKLLAFRQCPKRLWLELHRADLKEVSDTTETSFEVGYQVGEVARRLFDCAGDAVLLDIEQLGFDGVFAQTQAWLNTAQPLFEAGFKAAGVMAFADVMLPVQHDGGHSWRMVEVKSSTSVKDYHRDDIAIQAYVAQLAGVSLQCVAVACIDSSWVYPGGGDYAGLLREHDLTEQTLARADEVASWATAAQHVAAQADAPQVVVGEQCDVPFACPFFSHCTRDVVPAQQPIHWLPGRKSQALQHYVQQHQIQELADAPSELLNEKQQRVQTATLTGQTYFDAAGAAAQLAAFAPPAYFMDFETMMFAVPIWSGTRPYQQIPFQFSVHYLAADGKLRHAEFLDLSGQDPSYQFACRLLQACGEQGPIFVYHAAFESSRINELAQRFADLADGLQALNQRIVDLLPIVREHYYHPSQQGSWSLKAVLPAMCPELSYQQLDGVQNGGMAMQAYQEAICASTTPQRKAEIERQLLAYCELDTLAMVRMREVLVGNK